jgi:tetratricopeptide (TPR) repeat protein
MLSDRSVVLNHQGLRKSRQYCFALLLASSAVACASDLDRAAPIAKTAAAFGPQQVAANEPASLVDDAHTTRVLLQPGGLPHVNLSADILYQILAADIAAQRGELLPAANTTLELAKKTADPRLAKRAVELYAALGDLQGALSAAQVWVANAPFDDNALTTQMALSAAAGQTQGLAEALAKNIKSNANKTEALANAMNILRRMQNRQEAMLVLESAIEQSQIAGTMPAHMALSDMAHSASDNERALREARSASLIQPSSEDAAMRLLDYGMAIDAQAAIAGAQQFARAYPQARQLRLMLAGKLAERGDVQAALKELSLMSSEFPEDFDLLFIRAQLAYQEQLYEQAQTFLLQYIEVQSQRLDAMASGASDAGAALADAYMLLSRIAEQQQDLDQAIVWLGNIKDPDALFNARLRQATLRADQGRVDEAMAIIDATHYADYEEQIISVLTAAQILRKAQRYDQAIDRLQAVDQEVRDSVEIKYELGMLLERQKRHQEMETYLREVIELDPGYAHAYNALGYSLADRNERIEEAYDLIMRAHQILPEDPFILDSLGWVKFRLGDNSQAEQYLRQAFAISPQAEIAAHLGEVLWAQGEQEQAREVWRQGLAIDGSDQILLETLTRFGVQQ